MSYSIRAPEEADISSVIRLFRSYINNSFFARLGDQFLGLLFQGLIRSDRGICFVAEDNHKIVGFIFAASDCPAFCKELIFKNIRPILFITLSSIFGKEALLKELWQSLLHLVRGIGDPVKAELLFIAIEPDKRRQGIAAEFIGRVLSEMKLRKVEKVKVTTDHANNSVNNLLKKMNFCFIGTYLLYGKRMCLYNHKILALRQ